MVLLERSAGSTLTVRGWREVPVPDGLDYGTPDYGTFLGEGITSLVGRVRGSLQVWASLNPDHVRIHSVAVGFKSEVQLAKAVYWAVQNEEAFNEAEVLLDFDVDRVQAGQKATARQASVTAYLVNRSEVSRQEHLFITAGYPLAGLILPLRSIACLAQGGWLVEEGQALAVSHISETMARIAVFQDGRPVVLRGIPVGVDSLAEGVVEARGGGIGLATAYRLIQAAAEGNGDPSVLETIEPGLDRMARQIDRTVAFYQNNLGPEGGLGKVLATGQLSGYPVVANTLAGQLSVPLAGLDPFGHPRLRAGVALPEEAGTRERLATAVGVALAPQLEGHNFLRPYEDRQRLRRGERLNKFIFAGFLLIVFGCGLFYGLRLAELSRLRGELQAVRAQVRESGISLKAAELDSRIEQLKQMRDPLRALAVEREGAAALVELSRLTPPHIRLQEASMRMEAPASRWVRLEGWSEGNGVTAETQVQLYGRSLQQSPLFSRADVRETREEPGGDRGLFFAMELELAPLVEGAL